jgi:GNAT superfamily N-acetyltransferase
MTSPVQAPPPGFRVAPFDRRRHEQFTIECMLGSMRVANPATADDEPFRANLRKMLDEIEAGTRNDRVQILETETGEPAAMVWLEIRTYNEGFDGHHDPEMWPQLMGKAGAQIRNTHTLAPYRRRGLSRYLKLLSEQVAREAGAAFLYTRCAKHNEPMLALNRALGYEMTPETPQQGDMMRLRKKLSADAW